MSITTQDVMLLAALASKKLSPLPARANYEAKAHERVIRGEDLEDGMIVLIAERTFREFGDKLPSKKDYNYARWRETRYWCVVTDLKISDHDIVSFVGLYADGRKIPRTYHKSIFWIVREV